MTTKEKIQAQLDQLPDEDLEELYGIIKRFVDLKGSAEATGILGKLKQVQIEGPIDFASNLDLYLTGEKCIEENLA